MKILVVCYEYPPVGGGGGRIAARVAAGLVARGHEVRVVTAGLAHLPAKETIDGVEVHRPRSFRKREDTCSVPEMAMYLLTAFLPALRICRAWKPDVIHAHFVVPSGALAWALNRFTGIPYVLTAHLGDVPGGVPEQTAGLFRILNPFIRPIWKGAAAITAVSSFVADLARKASGSEARVILNGIDGTPDEPRTQAGNPPRIVMLGRLSVQKDPLMAIRALARIRDLAWEFEVIGDGPLATAARALADEEQLTSRITFAGWLKAEDVAERMRAADVLLMTSLHEGLPVAGIEALQHGLVIVGSRIGGLADVVSDGVNGFLVERTPAAFADALRRVISDPPLFLALSAASLRMASAFRMDDRVRDYEDFLLSATRRKTPPSAPSRS